MGKHAVVSGTSSGIGLATAGRLLADGWTVTGLDLAPPALDHAAFRAVTCDLCDAPRLKAAVAALDDADAMIHCAGYMKTAPLGALDAEDGLGMWRVHILAAQIMADALMPRMPDGGRVVLIGSRTASGAAGRSQYAACKSAMTGMARSWALEVVSRRIAVNIVSPAATRTAMLDDPARGTAPPVRPPMGRFIQAEEVAGLVAFLLSPAAAAITGQNIVMCAGASL
ncbi:SDR family NAD(P)-dependent oxidoreductase [Bordetella bronchialis]|uniref:Oxidoreductase n=1 Tax=Bordetella bronchialis TaxID=463025 RepID=A0ABN4R2F2_9BORD|nr:SDR family oxidoreductase [Bordetella bronchialis]ANN66635.1 oxidoreductase [Bordetella bronchialis]